MFLSQTHPNRLFAILLAVLLTACSDSGNDAISKETELQQSNSPILEVYKKASCGCCRKWMSHLEKNGFQTISYNVNDLVTFKTDRNIQPQYQSCHTAISKEGYIFEGHIPAKVIHQFLRERPEGTIGLSVPGMPLGSPGMEAGDNFRPYTVLLLNSDGSHKPYVQINSRREQE